MAMMGGGPGVYSGNNEHNYNGGYDNEFSAIKPTTFDSFFTVGPLMKEDYMLEMLSNNGCNDEWLEASEPGYIKGYKLMFDSAGRAVLKASKDEDDIVYGVMH